MTDPEDKVSKLHLIYDLWDCGDLKFSLDPDSLVDLIEQHINYSYDLAIEVAEYRELKVGNTYTDVIDILEYRKDPEAYDKKMENESVDLADIQKAQQISNMFADAKKNMGKHCPW